MMIGAVDTTGWARLLARTASRFIRDRVLSVAASVAFFLLLALVPGIAAFVSIYGLVADETRAVAHAELLRGVLPDEVVTFIARQVAEIAAAGQGSLTLTSLASLALGIWSANGGTKALIDALNVAYGVPETRSFLKLNLLSLGLTLGVMALGLVIIALVVIVPVVLSFLPLGGFADAIIGLGRWPVILAALFATLAVLYYAGPDREAPSWRWITPGAVVAAVGAIVFSMLFAWYTANIGDYNRTYGSLGAIVGFLIWTWLSVTIVLIGAEINSELEAAETGRAPR